MIPVNRELRAILQPGLAIDNQGLLLDKYHEAAGPQEDQKDKLVPVTRFLPNDGLLKRVLNRRREALTASHAECWPRTTSGPLTLQLSRAGSFENAGICLHPVYGFVYLPGTGVKGMARAYAELNGEPREEIEAVFGKGGDDDAEAGQVVFHEAWPVRWPELVVDIVNNHHSKYYQGGESDPPDDCENPIPVAFLAVKRGCEFEFAVGPRPGRACDQQLLGRAKQWLDGALTVLGAGAKTKAGYGYFTPVASVEPGAGFAQFTCTLRLETPAFLAGAMQSSDECDLRPATLVGLLRWWWRTLHAGHLSVNELRKLEADVWGDTQAGSAVTLRVEAIGSSDPQPHDPRGLARALRLQSPPDKTAQGLLYASYGMEASRNKPAARHYLPPGATWKLTLTARHRGSMTPEDTLQHAVLALWMLCRHGGVGAKGRRGFGSLKAENPALGWPDGFEFVKRESERLRGQAPRRHQPVSSSIEWLAVEELRLPGKEHWFALDQLGFAYQSFCKAYKHRPQKWALGLPRNTEIDWPRLTPADQKYPNVTSRYERFASPLHFHVFRDERGYAVRIAAFANPRLPDLATSGNFLGECLTHMRKELERRQREVTVPALSQVSQTAVRTVQSVRPPAIGTPQNGTKVSGTLVELIEKPNKKKTWKVRVEGFEKPGSIVNTTEMPGTLKVGDAVHLVVTDLKVPNLRWLKE